MKLRSGFVYKYVKPKKKSNNSKKNKSCNKVDDLCCICYQKYTSKRNCKVSCSKSNLNKHGYHINCIKEYLHYKILDNPYNSLECPYCRKELNQFYSKSKVYFIKK